MKKMRPMDSGDNSSDDEISVGCPSPQLHVSSTGDDKMEDDMDVAESRKQETTKDIVMTSQHIRPEGDDTKNSAAGGVRSFSILDILNHRPSANPPSSTPESSPNICSSAKLRRKSSNAEQQHPTIESPNHTHPGGMLHPTDADSPTKIMRPWDYPHLSLPAHFQAAAAAAAAGFLNPNRCLPFHPASSPFLPAPHHFGLSSHPAAGLGFHHPHHANFHSHHHHLQQQHQQQQQQRAAAGSTFVGGILSIGGSSSGHLSPSSSSASPDYISAGGSSDCDADDVCSTSGNSATSGGSPLLQQQQRQKTLLNSGSLVVKNNNNATGSARKSSSSSAAVKKSSSDSGKGAAATSAGGTPLDALFQMTSKTFDGSSTNGADSSGSQTGSGHGGGGGGGGGSGALFSPRQQAKKKRKSRTAFTNHQIFELEKRFLYQKYLSPADRDEIALTLGLTNAQVITWFQNRRAKLKRDMEELKKDVESAKILGTHHHHHHHHHKAFIGAMDLNLLQKKADEYNQAMAAASD